MTIECANPYPGPEFFIRGDARPYFGRDQETTDLSSMSVTERVLVFYAPSGAGKTSLLNMRLIPRLEEKLYEVLPTARVSGTASLPADVHNVYTYNLMMRLAPDDPQPERFAELSLSDFLWHLSTADGKAYLYDPSDQALRLATPAHDLWPRVLILDQFEEIVTTYPAKWKHREDFFRQIDEALTADPMLRVVLSLRSDYAQTLERYAGLLHHGLRARYQMPLMGIEDALCAIEGPATACGRTFVPGVARRLVENMSQVRDVDAEGNVVTAPGEAVEPIQLQVVCYQLWESMKGAPGDRIEMADLWRLARESQAQRSTEAPVGVQDENYLLSVFIDGALGAFYERALKDAMSSASIQIDEAFLRNWFSSKLITESGTRGFLQRGEDETGGVSEEVVQELIDNHLLRSDTRGSVRLVELIHDRFVDPIIDANLLWNQQRRRALPWIDDAYSWYESGDSPETRTGVLLEGGALTAVLAQTRGHHLEPAVEEYLEASVKEQQKREDDAKLAATRRERDLLAESRNMLKKLTIALAVSAGLAILFLGAGLLSFRSQNKVNTDLNIEQARLITELDGLNGRLTITNTLLIETTNDLTHTNRALTAARDEAESLRVASLARNLLWDDPKEALLLSLAAEEFFTSTNESRSALLAAVINDDSFSPQDTFGFQEASLRQNILRHDNEITAMAVSPDGSTLLTASGPNVYMWSELGSPDPISRTLVVQDDLDVEQIALDGEGDSAILLNSDGTVTVIDVNEQEPTPRSFSFEGLDTYSEASAISPDGSILAVGSCLLSGDEDEGCLQGQVIMWKLGDLVGQRKLTEEPLRLRENSGGVTSLAFSLDGHVLAIGSSGGVVHIWGMPGIDDRPPLVQKIHKGAVSAVAFDSTDTILATADGEGDVSLWEVGDDRLIRRQEIDSAEVTQLVFNHSGQMLVTADDYGNVSLWDTTEGQRIGDQLSHYGENQKSPLDTIGFVPEQELLLTAGSDGRAIVWQLDEESWRSIACERAGRNLEYAEWERAFGDEPYRVICDAYPIHPSVVQAQIDEGRRLARNCSPDNNDDALKQFQDALDLDPDLGLKPAAELARVLRDQARVWLRESNEVIARDCLEEANQLVIDEHLDSITIADVDNMISASRQLKILYDQIQELVKDGDYTDALDLLGQAVEYSQTVGQIDPLLIHIYFDLCQTAGSFESSQQGDLACQRVAELAPRVRPGDPISGDVADRNVYAFSGSAGEVVRIALSEDGSYIDTVLRVWHPDGTMLYIDDDSGNGWNSLISGLSLPEDGVYLIEPSAYEEDGAYQLTLDSLQTRSLVVGERQDGTFEDLILWNLDGTAGKLVRIVMEADRSSVQPMVEIRDPNGNMLDAVVDSGSGANALASDMIALTAGAYAIIPFASGSQGTYTIVVEDVEPVPLNIGQSTRGDIGDGTIWQFAGKSGQIVRIAMGEDASGIDSLLNVKDARGITIAEDDDGGDGYDSLILMLVLPADGTYLVVPSAYEDYGSYTLSVEEIELQPIAVGETVSGNIEDGTIWRLTGNPGQIVRIALNDDGDDISPRLEILDLTGTVIAKNDDGSDSLNALIPGIMLSGADGFLIFPDAYETSGAYQLTVTEATLPDESSERLAATAPLLAAVERLVSQGKEAEALAILEEVATLYPELAYDPEMMVQRMKAKWLVEQAENALGGADLVSAREQAQEAASLAVILADTGLNLQICRLGQDSGLADTVAPACEFVRTEAATIAPGETVTGTIESGQPALWRLVDAATHEVVIVMKTETSTLDSVLTLYAGEDLAELDHNDDFSGRNLQIGPRLLGAVEPFLIEAGTLNDGSGSYTLEVVDMNAIEGTERQADMLIAEANRLIIDGYLAEDYAAAIERLDQALAIAPQLENTIQTAKAVALFVQAFAELDEGDETGSALHFQAVHEITADLNNSELDGLLCEIAIESDVDQSQPECQQAVALAPVLRPNEPVSGTFDLIDSGLLSLAGMVHAWRFEAKAGDTVTIRMWDEDLGLNTALRVLGGTALREVASNGDYDSSDSQIGPLTLTETGTYLILAYPYDYSRSGTYGLELTKE